MKSFILIRTTYLSDGSRVFNVELRHADFDCVTQADAEQLADKIRSAVEMHANTEINVIEV